MYVVGATRSVVIGPVVARRSVANLVVGGCAFGITGSTGGVRVTGTIRRIFPNAGITGMGAVGIHNHRHHRNMGGNCAPS